MKDEKASGIVFWVIIAGRKQKDDLLSELLKKGARLANTVYGRGTVEASYLENVLGLIPEENKALIVCVLPDSKTEDVIKMLVDEFQFDKPNTGIAFTIPVERLSF